MIHREEIPATGVSTRTISHTILSGQPHSTSQTERPETDGESSRSQLFERYFDLLGQYYGVDLREKSKEADMIEADSYECLRRQAGLWLSWLVSRARATTPCTHFLVDTGTFAFEEDRGPRGATGAI